METCYDFNWDRRRHIQRHCRALGPERELFFPQEPMTAPPVNWTGTPDGKNTLPAGHCYPVEWIATVRRRIEGVDRGAYLRDILEKLGLGRASDRELVTAVCAFVNHAIYYNPTQHPLENGNGGRILNPVELLELHDGRCGQGVAVTVALLREAGIEARFVQAHHHASCEAFYDGAWRLADALMFGAGQPTRDGEVVSVAALREEPYFADAFPLRCFVYHPEELLSADGYRILGHCFGEWGSLPYYSWYLGAPRDHPPTLPIPLPAQRLGEHRLRLRWTPGIKFGGGPIEYRLRLFADRARTEELHAATVTEPHYDWEVPERNRHYFYDVCAMDDHREKNPETWYPTLPGNFMLVPPEQYGWYGVL